MRITKRLLLRWAYSKPDGCRVGGIGYVANLIDCHHAKPYELLKGLHRCVTSGHEVRAGNTIDQVCIDGVIQPLTNLRDW